ncbi:MAG: FHA domain-containing protein [Proteobacteria bacterium]|nr:FHA domain-containing protein [Pseudomonadota bacterium]MCL2308573.1 FHA domain-containing protein [Pseudomonadota bacterium]
MPKLLLFLQDGDAREVLFDKDRITIGRRSDNDVALPYPGVSGRHAVISYLSADKCFVEDLKSTNGTLLNGVSLFERQQLKDRDQIDIGGQKFVFLEGRKPVENAKGKDEKKSKADAQKDSKSPEMDVASLSLTATHEYLSAKPTIPSAPERAMTEEELDEEEMISGLHFPTIIKTSSDDIPPPPRVNKEPAPLPTLDADLVPPPPPEGEFPSTAPPQPLEEPTYRLPPPVATLTAIAGPNNHRQLLLRYGEYVLGRPGYQLAVIRVGEEGCRLLPMEGEPPIELRGQAVPAEGILLADKDSFNVGRSPLLFELCPPEAAPSEGQEKENRE